MLYWVAEQVSQLFGHYMTYRGYCQKNCSGPCTCATNWLSAWGENRALDIEQLMGQARQEISAFQFQHAQDLEAWQRWLWQNHFHQDYLDILNIDDLFWQLLDGAQSRETALQRLPKQVVVFTVLDLPPMQLQFCAVWGNTLIFLFCTTILLRNTGQIVSILCGNSSTMYV